MKSYEKRQNQANRMIKRNSIDQVFEIAAVEDVVREFVNLKRRGANLLGLCPFHDEKTPSFTVSPSKGLYKCFGCGKGGNVAGFIMEHEKLSYPEAIRWLAAKYNVILEETEPKEGQVEKSVIDSLYIVNEFARDHFADQLWHTEQGKAIGLSYFKERGFREDIIKKFELGFTLEKWDDLLNAAKTKGFKETYLEQLGLIKRKDERKVFDFFRNRIMFTIHNISGKPIAFAGRILTNDKKAPKYINSPETEIYNKSRVLYGMAQAKNEIRKKDNCFIVEGYTDVISLHQAGIENVVASSGTAFTESQIKLIKRFTENITILFDSDAAGLKAANRSVELILEQNMNVRIVHLPEGDDPDTFIQKKGLSGFEEYVAEHEKDFILFKMDLLSKEATDDPVSKSRMVQDIVQVLSKIAEPIKRNLYIQTAAERLGIRERILVDQTNKLKREAFRKQSFVKKDEVEIIERQAAEVSTSEPQERVFTDRTETLEKYLASLLIEFGDKDYTLDVLVSHFILNSIQKIEIKYSPYKEIVDHFRSENTLYDEIIQNYEKTKEVITSEFFINHENYKIAEFAASILTSPYYLSDNWKNMFEIYITHRTLNYKKDIDNFFSLFQMNYLMKNIEMVQSRMKMQQNLDKTEATEQEITKLTKMHMELLNLKQEVAEKIGMVTVK